MNGTDLLQVNTGSGAGSVYEQRPVRSRPGVELVPTWRVDGEVTAEPHEVSLSARSLCTIEREHAATISATP